MATKARNPSPSFATIGATKEILGRLRNLQKELLAKNDHRGRSAASVIAYLLDHFDATKEKESK